VPSEYPRILYKSGVEPLIVNDDEAKKAALKDGYFLSEKESDAAAEKAAEKAKK
jgi:hypothetical protein